MGRVNGMGVFEGMMKRIMINQFMNDLISNSWTMGH